MSIQYDDSGTPICSCGHETWDHEDVYIEPFGYSQDEINEYYIEGWYEFGGCKLCGCKQYKYDEE